MVVVAPHNHGCTHNNHGCTHNNHGCSHNNHGCTHNNHGCNNNNHGCTHNNHGCTHNNHGCTNNNHGCTRNNHGCSHNNHGCTHNNHSCNNNNHGCTHNNHGCTNNNHGCTHNNHGCTSNYHGCTHSNHTILQYQSWVVVVAPHNYSCTQNNHTILPYRFMVVVALQNHGCTHNNHGCTNNNHGYTHNNHSCTHNNHGCTHNNHVDAPAPSCRVGDYLPQFLHPTPANGERLHAEANKEVEIRVKAQANYATLEGIIISGPLRVTKHRTTHNEFAIRWTPATDDVGDHFPICFAAEAKAGSRVYQSEMRCVLVVVVQDSVKTNVICQESTMTVEVERASLSGIRVDHLRLNDRSNTACSLQSHSNSTHIVAVIPLNSCGTQIEEDDDNLLFKNEITTIDDVSTLITRKHLLEVEFYCQYPKRGNVTLGFTAHRSSFTMWEKGFGTFTYEFEFFHGSSFQRMMDPSLYPLVYDVGERIYMQIEAISSINNTELFVESCRAAPYDNPNYTPTYSIIENGCEVDATTQIHSPNHQNHFSFSMEAFKFIGKHDQVYISCSVMVCEAGNPNTRCSQGCIKSTSPQSYSHHRGKREAIIQTAKHFVSQGPLRLRSSESTATNLNLNLNLVFIAGCLLAAVGMICAVVIYKSKASKIKYQPLPSFEN
ncbi:uncharacterized protein LOC115380476 [Myripristis murdjan]|uniref:uncharacterized protein LOC115380476 n=1 Tax=Myripristis murdjan TaxID=586833 RepID=UPI0011762E0E|nr:uncharacterized protein LOC115380476 [Myripristis murdjan]